MANNKLIARNAIIIFIGMFLVKPVTFLVNLLIAKSLGPEGFGLYSLGLALFSLLGIICLIGLPVALPPLVSHYRAKGEMEKVKVVIRNSMGIVLMASIFFGTLFFIFSGNISSLFENAKLSNVIKLFSVALPIFVLYQVVYILP